MLKSKTKIIGLKGLLARVAAFDNTGGWKMNADNTAVEVKDGHPVWLGTDGKEMVVKGDTLSALRGEAKSHREAKEALETRFKDYEGLDPKAAREAIEKLKGIDQGQLIAAGKVDEVKNQITTEFNGKLAEKDKAFESLGGKYSALLVNNVFANSEFVRNNLAIPRDMFEAYFRGNFKVENDQVVAYDKAGNRVMSKENVGEFATADEALAILVNQHPQKDIILKADVGSGSGNGGGGGNSGVGRTVKRGEFNKLSPAKQSEIAAKVRAGEMQLVD